MFLSAELLKGWDRDYSVTEQGSESAVSLKKQRSESAVLQKHVNESAVSLKQGSESALSSVNGNFVQK
jgi:hypothetical protein